MYETASDHLAGVLKKLRSEQADLDAMTEVYLKVLEEGQAAAAEGNSETSADYTQPDPVFVNTCPGWDCHQEGQICVAGDAKIYICRSESPNCQGQFCWEDHVGEAPARWRCYDYLRASPNNTAKFTKCMFLLEH
jgi:hypothetical protein